MNRIFIESPVAAPTRGDCIIIIPTYNECENILRLLTRIFAVSPRVSVLVVDDNSPDGTADIVAARIPDEPRLALLKRPGKLGLGTAYLEGFRYALQRGAQFIFEMDADFSHDPRYLPDILAVAEQGADVVLGSRYVAGGQTSDWGIVRQAISRGGNVYTRLVLGLPFADCTGGFRCYRQHVLKTINLDAVRSNGYSFQIEMLYRAARLGAHIQEVPIVFADRRVGASKMSHKIILEAMLIVWKMRFFPDRMALHRTTLPEPVSMEL